MRKAHFLSKTVAIVFAVILVATAVCLRVLSYASGSNLDLTGDGNADISDVTALLNFLADSKNLPAAGAEAADINGDGQYDIADVTALLNALANPAAPELTPSEGLEYTLNSDRNSYSVAGIGSCKDTDVVIPATYNGKPVTRIEVSAFRGCSRLTSVTIPDSVTRIGQVVFYNCTKLTSITIPNSVVSIEAGAFYNCTGLTSVTIGNSVTNVGSGVFSGTAYYNDESNWENDVLYIGKCLIEAKESLSGSYTIKDGTTCIADWAFDDCTDLTSVTIPDSVIRIGDEAFYECKRLNSVTIPDSVTSIGNSAFAGCAGLTSVTIPDSVTSIGIGAFYSCSELTSITIPDITTIGKTAFYNCTGLTSIVIPDSVTSIGYRAFENCSGLTSITIGNGVTSIGSSAFYGTAYYNDESNWENDVLYIGKYLIDAKESISGSYSIREGTACIADNSFRDCSKLTGITIPDSVISIGDAAFAQCYGLTGVTIPDSVTSIGDNAFRGCYGFTSFPGISMGIPTGLTNVTIGNGVTSIGNRTFYGCSCLTSVTYNGTVEQWREISKGNVWKDSAGNFTVYCTDGNISCADA